MAILLGLLAFLVNVHLYTGEIVNMALNKPAAMSSIFNANDADYSAGNAVDGNTTAVWPGIIHTAQAEIFAWWMVDLLIQAEDPTVKIYFRTHYKWRRNGVQLYTSTTPFSSYPGGQLCHTVTGERDGTDIPDVVSVNCSGTWRYLLVYTEAYNDAVGPVLDFGEVQVLVCSPGTYSAKCTKICSSRQCAVTSTSCDRYTGECPGGCKAGWMGTDCRQECYIGTYGVNCAKSCSSRHCVGPSTYCDRIIGACPGGCQAGWRGIDCKEECPNGYYGENCSGLCCSRQCGVTSPTCDRSTGVCLGGCKPGWRGIACTQVCVSGTYGPGCNMSCEDRKCSSSSSCDHVIGKCDGGCQPGWVDEDCTQICPSGTYGAGCRSTCVCVGHDTCDHVTGNCPGDSKAIYQGGSQHEIASVTSSLIGGLVGVIVTLAVIGGVCVYLIRQGRIQWSISWPKESKPTTQMSDPHVEENLSNSQSDAAHVFNTDYSVLDGQCRSDHRDYDVIREDS